MICFEFFWIDIPMSWWADLATVVTALTAIVAVIFACCQINVAKKENKRAIAHTAYDRYLDLCLEKTRYSFGYEGNTQPFGDDGYKEYRWFVTKMLFAFEQILEIYARDDKWEKTLLSQLQRHKSHLIHSKTVINGDWSEPLMRLIQKVQEKV